MTAAAAAGTIERDKGLARLRELVVGADYPHATEQFLRLLGEGYRAEQLMGAAISVTAPFVQAPSHIIVRPDGTARGVNYDHTILAWRGSDRLARNLPKQTALLPLAQAIWYTPQGLDVWSQIHCEFPGHYARDQEKCGDKDEHRLPSGNKFDSPAWRGPKVHFGDLPPIREGSVEQRLHELLEAIMEGDRARSYGLFLGLSEEPAARERLKEATLFAGIIDLEETVIQRGGYQNIGHKALRARALVDLADTLGWEQAHDVFYTVVPDFACTPRFYELWALTTVLLPQEFRNWQELKHANTARLSERDLNELIDTILWSDPGEVSALITRLLRAGKALLAIADGIVDAYVHYIWEVVDHPAAFFNPGHSFDYCNVVNHWLRTYENPHQAKALYFEALFVNDLIRANALFPRDPAAEIAPFARRLPAAEALTPDEMLVELDAACRSQTDPAWAMALVDAYLRATDERTNLIATLGQAGATIQNDPHIARLCMTSIEEYRHNQTSRKDDILRAWAKYLARAVRRSNDTSCWELYRQMVAARGA